MLHQRIKSSSVLPTQPKKSHSTFELETSSQRTTTTTTSLISKQMGGCRCINTTILSSIKIKGWICFLFSSFILIVVSSLFLGTEWIYDELPGKDLNINTEQNIKSVLAIAIPILMAIIPITIVICDCCVSPHRIVNEYSIERKSDTPGSVQHRSNRENQALLQQQQQQEQIQTLNKTVSTLEESNQKKQDELDILQQEYTKSETIIKQLENEKREIQTQISDQEQTTIDIENKKKKYKDKCMTLQTEKQTLLDEKQILENETQILENKNQILEQQKQNLEQLQSGNVDAYESKDDKKELIHIKQLESEMKNMKLQNNKLKDQLQQQIHGKGIESGFIKEEDFSTKKISPFRQQTFKNLFDDLFEEMEEKYVDLDIEEEESDEDDSKDEIDKVMNEETDTKPKFELLIDRCAYEFLFDLLMVSYEFMKERKLKICQIVSKQLNIENNKEQKAEDIADIMIHPQLQQQWEYYLKKKMENVYGIMVDEIDVVIDEIFEKICGYNKYKNWDFLKTKFEKKVKEYIWKSCEICWIMILTKPKLTFYPNEFRMFVNDKENEYFYNAKDKHDLWTGSKTKDGAKILFFAMPAVVQSHFMNKNQKMHIIKGTLFAHNNEELMEYVMSDPDELLEIQS